MKSHNVLKAALSALLLALVAFPALAIYEGGYVCREENGAVNETWSFIKHFSWEHYYWAYPFEFTTHDHLYLDWMDVAFFSGHGGHGVITTLRNCCDHVNFWDGSVSLGDDYLEFITVDACSVAPAPPDVGNTWDDGWWDVFHRLHQFLSFRGAGWYNGTVEDNYGSYLKAGQTFMTAWMNAANSVRSGGEYPGYTSIIWAYPQGSYGGAHNDRYIPYPTQDPPNNLGTIAITWQY